MTDAVIAAAQALLYTEVSARVILVSDGTFRATNGEGGPVITDQVIWTIASDARVIAENETGNLIPLDAIEGTHRATATRVVQELTEETLFTAPGAGDVRSPCPLTPPRRWPPSAAPQLPRLARPCPSNGLARMQISTALLSPSPASVTTKPTPILRTTACLICKCHSNLACRNYAMSAARTILGSALCSKSRRRTSASWRPTPPRRVTRLT